MGLCKCPKRKVTNQFCFEHRVNVCEHCMVSNHPKCIIQSYLLWLQDSDCNPICTLCSTELNTRECVRLTCYHVYHWACLDKYARNLSSAEVSESFICPTCTGRIIPQRNLVSPVADILREKLSKVNWARPSLGLPPLDEEQEDKPDQQQNFQAQKNPTTSVFQNHVSPPTKSAVPRTVTSMNSIPSSPRPITPKQGPPYSVVNVDSNLPSTSARKVFEAYDDPKEMLFDHDENKYQRKSALEWFLRWWSLIMRPHSRRRHTGSLQKRYALLICLGIGMLVFIIMILSWLGKMATDGDPSYDPMNNPMINVNERS